MTWGISPWGADAWGTAAAEEAATGPLYTAPTLNSSKAYVVNLDSGEPHYYEKSPSTAANMQSTVKLMTALIVMEEFGTKALLEAEDVTIISADRTAGGTGANLQDGDVWTLWTLLLDALIPSSNDACLAMARYIGDKMYADAGDTGTQGVTRFVEAMNAKATALGMGNTTYVVPHGLLDGSSNPNTTTAEDMGKLALAADLVLANQDILDAMYYRQTTITIDRSGSQDLTIEKADGGENVPGYIIGKNGLGSQAHLWTVSNLPNGDRLFIMTSGASNYRSSDADHINLYRQLVQTDASGTLGTAANEATPAWVAGQASVNLLAFDDTGMYQDDGQVTAADADTDPVRRWYPVTEVGVSGNYLRADSVGERPERDAAGKINWNSGTNAELHLGSTGFGGTTFFADSGDAFTILCNTEGGVTAGTVFARAGTGNTDLRFYYTTQFAHQITIRGTTQDPDVGALNSTSADGGGQEGVHGLMWDGTEASALAGGISLPGQVTAGADSESTNNLSFGNNGGTDAWEGVQGRTILVDGALSKTQLRQLHAWCMGVTLDQTLVGVVDEAPAITGTGQVDLNSLSVTGAGAVVVSGSGSVNLNALSVQGSGSVSGLIAGTGQANLNTLQAEGSGAVVAPVTGAGEAALNALQAEGAGTVVTSVTGAGITTLNTLTVTGAGQAVTNVTGAGIAVLNTLSVTGGNVPENTLSSGRVRTRRGTFKNTTRTGSFASITEN